MSDEMFILEMMPYVMGITAMALFFLYLTARVIFLPKKDKTLKKRIKGKTGLTDLETTTLQEILRRAEDLQNRVRNLEEIIEAERSEKVP